MDIAGPDCDMHDITSRPTLDDIHRLAARVTGDEKHEAAAASPLDALFVLYDRVLRFDAQDPTWEGRDRFILSKGHGPASFYAVLAAHGFFPEEWLDDFMGHDSRLGAHPDRRLVPGVEASTGSLGHGLPMALGVALAVRAKRLDARVVVLCGDAELNEGSNWEAILTAPFLRLGNLTLLVIDNHSSSMSMAPWEDKFGSFGWRATVVHGRDHDALASALRWTDPEVPSAVIADVPEEA
jgi:transketolase